MSTTQENLEERIVRIRKRDEEIEKKHRAAEEDRLLALKHNAMVKTKSPTDDDWPKGHKYDSLDFTYDQNEQPDDEKSSKKTEKDKFAPKPGREYKKFADGSGPPPDPTYNFLKDAERDGVTEKVTTNEKKDWRQANGGNNNNRNKNGLNNSFRGRNSKPRNGNNGGGGNRYANKNEEYGSWKNERDRIDESRIGRQKSGDGKWRREWDTDKNSEEDMSNQMEKAFITDSLRPLQQSQQQQQQQQQQFQMQSQQIQQQQKQHQLQRDHQPHQHPLSPPSQQQQQFHFQPRSPTHSMRPIQPTQHLTETPMEKRGNIMVSVSQDGEVKSVKFQSTKAIGTGRVGPRQNSKPQFSIQKDAFPIVTQYQPDATPYFVAPMPISPRRLGPSLQDRLNRHRQPQQSQQQQPQQNNSFDGKNNPSTTASESAQIAVGF
ncbi:GATA zinc finger domain-containing protein 10-like [Bradysia coprophila]|uniref:GATA zinc finger domain-containing protein 10-like n=1 Tax=Bradysia coprophila TaxID=38358 RepID=UPI00187DC1CE|nr:GATA zinc finger domain-containing protein 10-like [Bradysia coprophila]